ncbi:hypothetical protein Tco_1106173 [Tanacetum coccineum]
MSETEPIPPTSSVTALRIPIIKKGEYDLWSMKMRQYIAITDHILWDIITNGNQTTTDPASPSVSAPKTSLAANARRNNEKALNILLSAIPDRHLLSFHDAVDARSLWKAIKARFGGNEASKKMQKNLLKQQFETFTIGSREELDSAYERFQHILSMLELHDATVSIEDANLKFLRSLPSVWHPYFVETQMASVKSLVRFGNFSSSPELIYDNTSMEAVVTLVTTASANDRRTKAQMYETKAVPSALDTLNECKWDLGFAWNGLDLFKYARVHDHQEAGTLSSIIDPRLGNSFTAEGMEEYIQLIVRCVEVSSERRPTMSYIVTELDRILEKEMSLTTIMGEGVFLDTLDTRKEKNSLAWYGLSVAV